MHPLCKKKLQIQKGVFDFVVQKWNFVLRVLLKNNIIFPLDFLYRCAILSQTVDVYTVQKTVFYSF